MKKIKASHLEAIISDEDYDRVSQYNWWLLKAGYVYTQTCIKGKRTTILLHSFIMTPAKGTEIDHINGDVLDNRRENLRLASRSQNCGNRRSFGKLKGIYWNKNAWQAQIKKDGEYVYLGRFKDPMEAARKYDEKATELFGDFACVNFPMGGV